ncbi:hypothetical protein COV12_01910 [Candidatus Woesearchaeota archaeon CG10_big_fil_rev_8_21_14_0_10_32_24]|nr:MAG: hypothetical protein COV12_01910 [Candidatus Woesearchaeota archaeon CG10_big_fil_rev_8_21_14_0_10_32_24]
MVSEKVLAFFPHDKIRDGQKELVADVEIALNEGKILLAHAPTGLGKTAAALSVALQHAIEHKNVIFFLTNRHTQHKIAIDTLKQIRKKTGHDFSCVDLIGKRWMCNQEIAGLFGNEFNEYCKAIVGKGECEFYNKVKDKNNLQVEAKVFLKDLERLGPIHNEELISLAKEKRMCSYEISLAHAKNAKIIIGDYYYLFNPFVQSTLFNKLDIEMEDIILIVDEAHNLPSRVTDMMSSNLTSYMIKNGIQEAKKFGYPGLINWLQEINGILNKLAVFEGSEKEKKIRQSQFTDNIRLVTDYDDLINELDLAADEIRKKQRKSYLGGIAGFLEEWKGSDEGFTRIISEEYGRQESMVKLRYACLDPSLTTGVVFSGIHAGILMSGTLKPTYMYKDVLGVKNGIEKEYSSPFPPENKRVIIIPETSTKFNLRGEPMYKKIAEYCMEIDKLVPGNLAFFFPSYNLRDQISMYFNTQKKLFFEKNGMTKEEKERFLADFKSARITGGVLLAVIGANFAEGVDFPGDLLKGVVVVGLPLARPDLMTKETIAYYDMKFNKGWNYGYTFPAMNKCFQSAGRCIRSGTDKGIIVYLEERFAWDMYYSCFPDKVGLMVTRDYKKIIGDFFG